MTVTQPAEPHTRAHLPQVLLLYCTSFSEA